MSAQGGDTGPPSASSSQTAERPRNVGEMLERARAFLERKGVDSLLDTITRGRRAWMRISWWPTPSRSIGCTFC